MKNARIGVVCLVRNTFDYSAAGELYRGTLADIRSIPGVEWVAIEELIFEPEEALAACKRLEAEALDALVVISGTFHLGHLALIFEQRLHKPMLLWGYNELPYNGGKIRLNSVCGVNLNASNLYKSGCDSYCCHVGDLIDREWVEAVKMKAAVTAAHVGLAGYRAHGFFNLDVEDLSLYRSTGILLDHYELSEVFGSFAENERGFSADDINKLFDCSGITGAQTDKVARLTNSIENFINANKLDAVAIRCWPEFAKSYGVSPCAAMSLLGAKGYILGCEGDIEGTVSMLACKAIAKLPVFLADLSQVNLAEDYAVMWHDGVAPYTLWDGRSVRSLDTYFAGGKGVTAGFVMREGDVTIMRIDSARGKTRLFLQHGVAMPMEKELCGTYAKVRFDKSISELLELVTTAGVAHHVVLLYGDCCAALRKFARIMNFDIIE